MTAAQFDKIANEIFDTLKPLVPYDTGNMANNATTMVKTAPNEYQIYVDAKIAPYVYYTNEPWIAPKWNGKPNPNEHWWNDAIEAIIERDIARLGKLGKIGRVNK